jgi:hypothetical protein
VNTIAKTTDEADRARHERDGDDDQRNSSQEHQESQESESDGELWHMPQRPAATRRRQRGNPCAPPWDTIKETARKKH